MKKLIKSVKVWFDMRIERRIKRELAKIFVQSGSVYVDHHIKQDSWAIIKIDTDPGCCYLKFVNLGKKDLLEIEQFLKRFERAGIDSTPEVTHQFKRFNDLFY